MSVESSDTASARSPAKSLALSRDGPVSEGKTSIS